MERLIREDLEHDGRQWRLRREMECPECGKFHLIDDLEEILNVSLYCDTYEKRIPLSRQKVELIREAEKLKDAEGRVPRANSNIPGRQGDRIPLFELRIQW